MSEKPFTVLHRFCGSTDNSGVRKRHGLNNIERPSGDCNKQMIPWMIPLPVLWQGRKRRRRWKGKDEAAAAVGAIRG